jgi:hypothetical protein
MKSILQSLALLGSVLATSASALAQDVMPRPRGKGTLKQTTKVLQTIATPSEVPVRIIVDTKGTVSRVEILIEVHGDLEAALRADISKWTFSPGSRNGKPVESAIAVPIVLKGTAKK